MKTQIIRDEDAHAFDFVFAEGLWSTFTPGTPAYQDTTGILPCLPE
jgi:hypothetical protein